MKTWLTWNSEVVLTLEESGWNSFLSFSAIFFEKKKNLETARLIFKFVVTSTKVSLSMIFLYLVSAFHWGLVIHCPYALQTHSDQMSWNTFPSHLPMRLAVYYIFLILLNGTITHLFLSKCSGGRSLFLTFNWLYIMQILFSFFVFIIYYLSSLSFLWIFTIASEFSPHVPPIYPPCYC